MWTARMRMTTKLRLMFLETIARAASAEHAKRHPALAARANGLDVYGPEDVENILRALLAVLTQGQGVVEYSIN